MIRHRTMSRDKDIDKSPVFDKFALRQIIPSLIKSTDDVAKAVIRYKRTKD